jgi:hypothetical protein
LWENVRGRLPNSAYPQFNKFGGIDISSVYPKSS